MSVFSEKMKNGQINKTILRNLALQIIKFKFYLPLQKEVHQNDVNNQSDGKTGVKSLLHE